MLLSRCQRILMIALVAGSAPGRLANVPGSTRPGSRRAASARRLPSDARSGSSCGVVIAASAPPNRTSPKAAGSTVDGALRLCDPTTPGTTTGASTAMSAAFATTLGSRTSAQTIPQDGTFLPARGRPKHATGGLQARDGHAGAAR